MSQPRHVDAVIASRFLRHELPLRLRHQDASLARLSGNTAQLERMLRPTLERWDAMGRCPMFKSANAFTIEQA